MPTQQTILGRTASSAVGSGTEFNGPFGWYNTGHDGTESNIQQVWHTAGKFQNFVVTLPSALGAGVTCTFTLRINGADSALAVTIAGASQTTATDSTHKVSVNPGDLLSIGVVRTGTVTTPCFTLEFKSNSGPGVSCYTNGGTPSAASTTLIAPISSGNAWGTSSSSKDDVIPTAGTIPGWEVKLGAAPGVGKTLTFAFVKNGTVQDGTSGTPDTRIAVTGNSATTGSASFSLSVAAGDTLRVQIVPASTPTVAVSSFSWEFDATTDGEFLIGGGDIGAIITTTSFTSLMDNGCNYPATETFINKLFVGVTGFTCKKLYVVINGGNATNLNITLVKNSVNSALTVNLTGVATANDTTHTVAVVNADVIDLTFTGTPGLNRSANWAIVGLAQVSGGGGASKGNSQSANKRGGGGALSILTPTGAQCISIGNAGLNLGSC